MPKQAIVNPTPGVQLPNSSIYAFKLWNKSAQDRTFLLGLHSYIGYILTIVGACKVFSWLLCFENAVRLKRVISLLLLLHRLNVFWTPPPTQLHTVFLPTIQVPTRQYSPDKIGCSHDNIDQIYIDLYARSSHTAACRDSLPCHYCTTKTFMCKVMPVV